MSRSSVERLLGVLNVLAASEVGLSRAQIRDTITSYRNAPSTAAFERTFERDKDSLRKLGYTLVTSKVGVETLYRIEHAKGSAHHLSVVDLSLLSLAAASWQEGVAHRSVERALAKLGVEQTQSANGHSEVVFKQAPYLEQVIEALAEQKVLSFDYTNARGETRSRRTSIWGIGFTFGTWYCMGVEATERQPRVYRLDRFTKAALTAGTYRSADGSFSAYDYLQGIASIPVPRVWLRRHGELLSIPAVVADKAAARILLSGATVEPNRPADIPAQQVFDDHIQLSMRERCRTMKAAVAGRHRGSEPCDTSSMRWEEHGAPRTRADAAELFVRILNYAEFAFENAPVSVKDIAERFAVTRAEVVRALNLLWISADEQSVSLNLTHDQVQRMEAVQHLRTAAPLSTEEIIYLLLALRALGAVMPETKILRQLEGKLVQLSAQGERLSHQIAVIADDSAPAWLIAALERRETVDITYSTGTSTTYRRIKPLELRMVDGELYVRAQCLLRDAERTFRLSGISLTSQQEQLPPAHHIETAPDARASFTAIVKAHLPGTYHRQLCQRHSNQVSGDYFSFDVFNPSWFMELILSSYGELEIIEPHSLRAYCATENGNPESLFDPQI
ncbi:WYL domain-containing protein [Rothia sp. ZJ932]|uniref:transcriptional regulator n=1 Tax=Rothia sp. ZJ932 TaxID=2810516 RepID=UPI001966D02D|nr:WYL domain-containing protein [Rothia sp. ZJ932]QRZ60748.1 WYL domain-containing protein [Rothia sp. ZJ932]